ncbi:MAG: UDP-3-O-(3-hydroxymyristoyl)glucosamine N-acyltransferase [Denitrovibrio sp.]|nr:MAG: UDP-3-O-(3-hydroxymyristoyl)glucosamine N-acyltransferase [Denitrovibrio sp.]
MNHVISPSAVVGSETKIGHFSVVSDDVKIGQGCVIGNNVIIHDGTIIGDNVRIDDNTVIGKRPMKAANSQITKDEELPAANISSNCIIGTSVVIYRGCSLGEKVLVADLSTVRENVTVGKFTIIGRGVAVENYCTIGSYCKLETNVYITAYSKLGDWCFIAPCVATSNDNYMGRSEQRKSEFEGVIIEDGGRVGVNATILPGKTIGSESMIAAGAVVTKDTAPKKIFAGLPAKEFGDIPEDQTLATHKEYINVNK